MRGRQDYRVRVPSSAMPPKGKKGGASKSKSKSKAKSSSSGGSAFDFGRNVTGVASSGPGAGPARRASQPSPPAPTGHDSGSSGPPSLVSSGEDSSDWDSDPCVCGEESESEADSDDIPDLVDSDDFSDEDDIGPPPGLLSDDSSDEDDEDHPDRPQRASGLASGFFGGGARPKPAPKPAPKSAPAPEPEPEEPTGPVLIHRPEPGILLRILGDPRYFGEKSFGWSGERDGEIVLQVLRKEKGADGRVSFDLSDGEA